MGLLSDLIPSGSDDAKGNIVGTSQASPDTKRFDPRNYIEYQNNVFTPGSGGGMSNAKADAARKVVLIQHQKLSPDVTGDDLLGTMDASTGVTAYLTGSINYSISADWSEEDGIISTITEALDGMTKKSGGATGSAGYATRKYYKGKSDLDLSLTFRILAGSSSVRMSDQKTSLGVQVAKLHKMVLPTVAATLQMTDIPGVDGALLAAQGIVQSANERVQRMGNQSGTGTAVESTEATAGQQSRASAPGSINGKGYSEWLATSLSNSLTEFEQSNITMTNAPNPVFLACGTWLQIPEAVVTSLNITYSEAVNADGPLWADVQLGLSTRENIAVYNKADDSSYAGLVGVKMFESSALALSNSEV